MDLILAARRDYTVARNKDPRVYGDMIGVCSRLHNSHGSKFEKATRYAAPGECPRYAEFRRYTTSINVAKVLMLESAEPGLEDIWGATMNRRNAREGIDAMLGSELGHLLEWAGRGFYATVSEARRIRKRYESNPRSMIPRMCKDWGNTDRCSYGEDCTHLHLSCDPSAIDKFVGYARHGYDD